MSQKKVNLSKRAEEAIFSDEKIIEYLELDRKEFEAGNLTALFDAIALCARFQAVIPEWLADQILAINKNLHLGMYHDWNEIFGEFDVKQIRLENRKRLILRQLYRLRYNNKGFTKVNFQEIAEHLGIGRDEVETVYRENKSALQSVPQKPRKKHTYGNVAIDIPWPRRRGRPILKD